MGSALFAKLTDTSRSSAKDRGLLAAHIVGFRCVRSSDADTRGYLKRNRPPTVVRRIISGIAFAVSLLVFKFELIKDRPTRILHFATLLTSTKVIF